MKAHMHPMKVGDEKEFSNFRLGALIVITWLAWAGVLVWLVYV